MLSTLTDYQDREISNTIRGTNVYGIADEKLGSVDDAIVAPDSGELRYLIVDAGWLKSRRFVVPADQVYAYGPSDEDLYVNLSKSEVENLPVFDEACLASEDAFTAYEREYNSAWHPRPQTTTERPSEHLLRLRDRIRDFHNGNRGRAAQRETSFHNVAAYSATAVPPTGVYGVYSDRKDVEKTVQVLKDQGFVSGDISVVFPNPNITKEFAIEKNTKAPEGALAGGGTGFVIGGVLGWLAGIGTLAIPGLGPLIAAGPIVAALAGAGAGGAIGGIAGALVGLGLPELEAKRFEAAIKQGRILVSVHCADMAVAEKARKVLDEHGAKEVFLSGERKAA
jgi:PRC-barrel domain protein/ActD protein